MGRQRRKLWEKQKNDSAETDEKILHALAQKPMTDKQLREATGLDASTLSDHRKHLMEGEKGEPLIGKHYNDFNDSLEYFANAPASVEYLEQYAARLMDHYQQLMKGTIEPLRKLVNAASKEKA